MQSSGTILCFLDADDAMENDRIAHQVALLQQHPYAITGTQIRREPDASTLRYTSWVNQLTDLQLVTQRYKECTVIQPTWMMKRDIFDALDGYRETCIAEDLDLFYRHLDKFALHHGYRSLVELDKQLVSCIKNSTKTKDSLKRSIRETPFVLLRRLSTVYTYRCVLQNINSCVSHLNILPEAETKSTY